MAGESKNHKNLIIGGIIAAAVVIAVIVAVIVIPKGNSGDNNSSQNSSLEAVTTTVDLTSGDYTIEQLDEVFAETDMSKSTRVTAYGMINTLRRKDKGENVYDYFLDPIVDKKIGEAVTWKEATRYEIPGNVVFDKIPEDDRPVRGDLVKITGVWKQDADPMASDYAFEFYAESVEIYENIN